MWQKARKGGKVHPGFGGHNLSVTAGGWAGVRELVTLPSAAREQREVNAGAQPAFLAFRPAPGHPQATGCCPLTFLVGLHLHLILSRKIPMSTCSYVSMVILNPVSRQ